MAVRREGEHARRERTPITEAVEDYAKAIFALQHRGDGPVTNSALAERLGVAPASVSAMVKRLAERELVRHVPYKGVELTEAGERLALEVIRHHRLLESYLAEAFGMTWDRVHAEAEVLEHYISEELEQLIAERLGNPKSDPHGDPIPDRDFALADQDTLTLEELKPGQAGTFIRVSDSDPEMLRYLAGRGIRPGLSVRVVEKQPFGGSLSIRVGKVVHPIGSDLAKAMRVVVA